MADNSGSSAILGVIVGVIIVGAILVLSSVSASPEEAVPARPMSMYR